MNKKNRRSLDIIAAEIHALQRKNVFAIGDLLIEAQNACDHGDWGGWLSEHFDWSQDSAERYMAVAKLGTKFRSLRNLKLAKVTLYALVREEKEADEQLLPAIIDALVKRASRATLKPADADDVIRLVKLRYQHGDLPDATLFALDRGYVPNTAWSDTAVAALKQQKPTTKEAADTIVDGIQRAHIDGLFSQYGHLPDVPPDALYLLEEIDSERRQRVLEQLLAAPQPLTEDQVRGICYRRDDDESEDDDESKPTDDATDDDATDDAPPSAPIEPELLQALRTVLDYARRSAPIQVAGITGTDLQVIADFVERLHNAMHSGNSVKLAADRAEARSKRLMIKAGTNNAST